MGVLRVYVCTNKNNECREREWELPLVGAVLILAVASQYIREPTSLPQQQQQT